MSKRTLRAAAMPFAHLIPGYRAAKADDDTDDKKKDDAAKKARAEDDELDTTDKVNEDDPGEGVDGDPTPDLDDVEDPDDSLDEDAAPEEDDVDPKVKKAAKSGRKAERARWAKVMGHSSAAGRVPAACQLLTTTTMSARSIVGTLRALPAAEAPVAGRTLQSRMAERPNPKIGSDHRGGAEPSFADQVRAAVTKVRSA